MVAKVRRNNCEAAGLTGTQGERLGLRRLVQSDVKDGCGPAGAVEDAAMSGRSTAASNSPTLSLKGLSPSHYAAWQTPSFLFEGHAQ